MAQPVLLDVSAYYGLVKQSKPTYAAGSLTQSTKNKTPLFSQNYLKKNKTKPKQKRKQNPNPQKLEAGERRGK